MCPVKDNKNVCYWPGVHAAVATWIEENKICSLVVPDQYEKRANIGPSTTRTKSKNIVESATKQSGCVNYLSKMCFTKMIVR